jgi:hypothetical protein
MIKELLDPIAAKYKVAITYTSTDDNQWKDLIEKEVAEITGFSGEPRIRLVSQKVDCRIEIEMELEKRGIDYVMNSSFNPDKLTVTLKQEAK